MPRRDDGNYMVAETIAWRIQREIAKSKRRGDDEDAPKLTEMNRKLAVEADLKELQLERERAESLPAEEFHSTISRVVGGFAATAKGRLSRFERDVVKATTPADARRLMDRISVALLEGGRDVAQMLDDEAAAEEEAAREESE